MGAWHVYLLECADGSLYCGITNDLERRLDAHNAGRGAKYTAGRIPVRLRWSEPHPDRAAASRREWEVKRLPRKRKLALTQHAPPRRHAPATPRPGDEVVNTHTGGRVRVLTVQNTAGDLVVEDPTDGPITLAADEWRWPWQARGGGCGCCGGP